MKFNSLQKKCLSCVYGVQDCSMVRCTNNFHPGCVGGTGTEWVSYCSDYVLDIKGGKKIIQQKIVRVKDN